MSTKKAVTRTFDSSLSANAAGSIDNISSGPSASLVITRNVSRELGVQTYIPPRLVRGIIPDCLLEKYHFWQSEDGDLIGYIPKPPGLAIQNDEDSSILEVHITNTSSADTSGFCSSSATGSVRRVPVLSGLDGIDGNVKLDPSKPTMYLVNLLYATSELASLRELMMRLENLSHCLVWSQSDLTSLDSISIDLIEFPRLNLSFRTRSTEDGALLLFSEDHAGLFVSNTRNPRLEQLLRGLPTSILLESVNHEFFILLPAGTKPIRPVIEGTPYATDVLLDRNNREWLRNLGDVRHYLYPLHPCGCFLFTSTLPATLYLLLTRFLAKQYDEVVQIAASCVSDSPLSPEEKQIFSQLNDVASDTSPDAVACRLHLALRLTGSEKNMQCPWDVDREAQEYIRLRKYVSAACRLTHEDEMQIMDICTSFSHQIANRKNYLTAYQSNPSGPVVRMEYPKKPRGFLPFDRLVDRTCVQPTLQDAFLGRLGTISYKRPIEIGTPEKPEEEIIGNRAMDMLRRWIGRGLRLSGGRDDLGFLFFYELLVGSLRFKLLRSDSTHALANVLLRLLPEADTQEGMLMSILRVLAQNPELAKQAPKYESEQRRFAKMFKGSDHFTGFIAKVKQFIDENQFKITWAEPYQV
eukprot:SAG11_NODE_43_length_20795_cov_11.860456_2_plen_638_part_00